LAHGNARMLADIVRHLVERKELSPGHMTEAVEEILSGGAQDVDIAAFLTALRLRGETASDLVAAVRVLRRYAVPFPTDGRKVVDTCGTGGDGLGTFNVSTATAFVVAGCGVPVVKHGNRSVSSRSGSADVLEALGVKVDVSPEVAKRCLDEAGMAFCFAPRYHPAVRHAARVRQRLGFRTLFNWLGPLANPAAAVSQVLGVGDAAMRPVVAEAALALGNLTAFIVHGSGMDEVSLSGPTQVAYVHEGLMEEDEWNPEDFGLPRQRRDSHQVPDATASAQLLQSILNGETSPATDLVLANAAAVLKLYGKANSLKEGVEQGREALASGKAHRTLTMLQLITFRVE
jgi:anthranilate phosphoribosyltransferase